VSSTQVDSSSLKNSLSLSPSSLPRHIAFIMDGNGRWACRKGLERTQGHYEGLKATKEVIRTLAELSIPHVTLYTFSTENWHRPPAEIAFLFSLISKYLLKEMDFYKEYGIRVRYIGNIDSLPSETQNSIRTAAEKTSAHDNITVHLAVNYGGRDELVRAFRRFLAHHGSENGDAAADVITADRIESCLDTAGIPDPDMIIRSSGEKRLSNFLLWQSAYSELFFTDELWPDFSKETVFSCIREYQSRKRKFGAVE